MKPVSVPMMKAVWHVQFLYSMHDRQGVKYAWISRVRECVPKRTWQAIVKRKLVTPLKSLVSITPEGHAAIKELDRITAVTKNLEGA